MKFNKKISVKEQVLLDPTITTNHEGGIAFKTTPELELYLRACTSLFEDKFYTTGDEQLLAIRELIGKCDREFVLKLANFVRNEMYLRSVPIMLLGEASRAPKGPSEEEGLLRKTVSKVCTRADQPAELLAYLKHQVLNESKQKISYAIKRGLSDALNSFNEYQLQKWDIGGKEFKLKDVINIVHPKPKNEEQSALFKKALNGELETAETWETHISTKGSNANTWEHVIDMWIIDD